MLDNVGVSEMEIGCEKDILAQNLILSTSRAETSPDPFVVMNRIRKRIDFKPANFIAVWMFPPF
jgi:hypothetical protein